MFKCLSNNFSFKCSRVFIFVTTDTRKANYFKVIFHFALSEIAKGTSVEHFVNPTLSCAQTNGVSTSEQMTLAVTLILIKIYCGS